MGNAKLSFKKNESFYIRDGWFEKALNTVSENDDVFVKNNGTEMLGIGSNMVKGLKYWLQASGIIETKGSITKLTELGELFKKYDQYFEDDFSWFVIHYNLCKNVPECPVLNGVFSSNLKSFKKSEFVEALCNKFSSDGYEVNKKYVEDDLNVVIKSYLVDEVITNPEDNYVCPLSNLKLLSKKEDKIQKNKPAFSSLSYLIVYYALCDWSKDSKSCVIEDVVNDETSPCAYFNLDKNLFLQYLEEMRKNDYITVNKTAGLNMVYFEKKINLEELFKLQYGGK